MPLHHWKLTAKSSVSQMTSSKLECLNTRSTPPAVGGSAPQTSSQVRAGVDTR